MRSRVSTVLARHGLPGKLFGALRGAGNVAGGLTASLKGSVSAGAVLAGALSLKMALAGTIEGGATLTGAMASPYVDPPSAYAYSIPLISQGSGGTAHPQGSPLASIAFTTSATEIVIETYNDYYSSFPDLSEIGLRINGAYSRAFAMTADGVATFTQALSAGEKTVEVITGPQSTTTVGQLGVFVNHVTFNAPAVQIFPTAANRLVVYGDSIAVGGNAGNPTQNAWVPKLREIYTAGTVGVIGWGSRSLNQDYVTDPTFATLVAQFVAMNPTHIWLCMGTNDYGLSKWTAADFGTQYANLLDALHTALPSTVIYAQTPLLRLTETANGSGDGCPAYRAAIAAAAAPRASYVTLVDGPAIVSLDDLIDGVHPTTAGHAKYAAAVYDSLNYNEATFTPAQIFAASEIGGWYDPSDLSTLFQDTAGTTLVTTAGQPVARINDKSGNGKHWLQATAGSRPTYQTDGTLRWLEFDGIDDGLGVASPGLGDQFSALMAYRLNTGKTKWISGNNNAETGGSYFGIANSGDGSSSAGAGAGSSASIHNRVNDVETADTLRSTFYTAIPNATPKVVEVRGLALASWARFDFGDYPAGFQIEGRLYGYILHANLSPAKRRGVERWLGAKAGLTL